MKHRNRKKAVMRSLSAALLAVTIAIPAEVFAQLVIEEIVVTARKREEALQDVPLSVTAFTEADIEGRLVDNLGELTAFAPNLEINRGRGDSGSTNASILIRGVGQNDFIFPTDPGVGLYVDGVYVARSIGGLLDMVDIARIEVLRGPQGTLYGKNTIGGAVNVISRQPDEQVSGMLRATVGEEDRRDIVGRVSFPIVSDRLFGKLTFTSRNQDGYTTRSDGLDLGDTDLNAVRGGLRWTPSDDLELGLLVDYTKIDQNGSPGTFLGTFPTPVLGLYNAVAAPLVVATQGLPAGSILDDRWIGSDRFQSNGTGLSHDENETWGVNLTIDKDFSDKLALRSITAFRGMDAKIAVDLDHTPFPMVETNQDQDQEQFSQEFQLGGQGVDGRLNWLLGLYYLSEDVEDINFPLLASGLFPGLGFVPGPFIPLRPFDTCPPATAADLCAGGAGNPLNAVFDFDPNPITELETTSTAGFAHFTFEFNERWSTTFGARFTNEEKDYFIDSTFPATGRIAMPPTNDSQDWSEFTPKLGVELRTSEDLMLYASYARGFKSGGWNPRPLSPEEFGRYEPETLDAYELGFKATLAGQRMFLNSAVFFSDYKDLQLVSNVVSPTTGGLLLIVQNAGEVDIYGAELELVASVTENLDFQLGVGYLETEYQALAPSVGWSIDNELPDAPKWTLNSVIALRTPLDQRGNLTWRLDVSYKDKTFKDPFNIEAISQDDYVLLHASVSWDSPGERWRARLHVKNVTDEDYITCGTSVAAFGINTANYGRPRQWGASISYSF